MGGPIVSEETLVPRYHLKRGTRRQVGTGSDACVGGDFVSLTSLGATKSPINSMETLHQASPHLPPAQILHQRSVSRWISRPAADLGRMVWSSGALMPHL